MNHDGLATDPLVRWLSEQVTASGYSYREVCRRAGLSESAISSYLSGRSRPLPAACRKLAHFFGIAEDIVLSLAGHRSIISPAPDGDREAFLELLREQPEEVITDIERWVRPFIRAHWQGRPVSKTGAPRTVELSIQLRWDEMMLHPEMS